MRIKYFLSLVFFLAAIASINATFAISHDYLVKPTGHYGVGFQDFHWLNTGLCPDPNYSGKNNNDFSSSNKGHCHEIMVRIYYPTAVTNQPSAYYYKPIVATIRDSVSNLPGVSKTHLRQLKQLKSVTVANSPILLGKKFPVILFSPGSGSHVQMYENFITELVSHGYIIVGINSPFMSGDITLSNGHIVKFNVTASLSETVNIPLQDLYFTYHKIHALNKVKPLFSAMDLHHMGALGQSLGGEIVANAVHAHPDWFKAAATLDSGIDKLDDTLKPFAFPFMRLIAANRITESAMPLVFDLEKNGLLVTLSPNKENDHYSRHLNFTDYSTLQYLPAEQIALAYFKRHGKKPMLGTGNGWNITYSINTYLLQYFNHYLKHNVNHNLKNCQPLVKNVFIRCGN